MKPFNGTTWQARHFWTHDSVQVRVPCKVPSDTIQVIERDGEFIACVQDGNSEWLRDKLKCPYCVGDLVPVREPWLSMREWDCGGAGAAYAADHVSDSVDKWHPASKMQPEDIRIHLRITSVSCGPVRETSDEDAIKCGFDGSYIMADTRERSNAYGKTVWNQFRDQWQADNPRGNFETDCCWIFDATVERGKR